MSLFENTYREFNLKIRGLVCEGKGRRYDTKHPTEKLVHTIWFGRHFIDKNLKTLDGKSIEIIFRGEYSVDGGPDFKGAILKVDGKTVKGDVETHLNLSDWEKHKHKFDEKYKNVILHIALNKDIDKIFATGFNSKKIPQLVLEDKLLKDISELMSELDEETHPEVKFGGFGKCHSIIHSDLSSKEKYLNYIDIAGDERILIKTDGLNKRVSKFGIKEVFYQGLMEALGYSFNKSQFLQLSLTLPISKLGNIVKDKNVSTERLMFLQSILFKTADLIPLQKDFDDAETVEYINNLKKFNENYDIKDVDIKFNFGGNRPQNSPYRRLAAASHLINSHLLSGLDEKIYSIFSKNSEIQKYDESIFNTVRKSIQSFFLDIRDSYWSYRTKFGEPSFSRSISLIGKSWVDIFIVNIAIPYILVKSRLLKDKKTESFLHFFYDRFPQLPENHITRYMKTRTVGDTSGSKSNVSHKMSFKEVNSARRQMGLIQIYFDTCLKGVEGCEICGLPSWISINDQKFLNNKRTISRGVIND